jgi:hypothetical protein
MKLEYVPPTEIEKQRSEWFAKHAKPGLTMDEFACLNDEALRLFPVTQEEREEKTRYLESIPEFVL